MTRLFGSRIIRMGWILVVVVTLAIMLPVGLAFAHDFSLPFKWDTDVTITVESRIPQSAHVHSAADDYDDNTDLTVKRCSPDSECGNVIHYDGYYGPSEPVAWASPYSYSVKCTNDEHELTGYCNETNHKVDFAYIYYNTHYTYDDLLVAVLARHEMGHVWGLNHTPCSVASVMKPGTCQNQYGNLQQHDKNDVNAKY